MLLINKRKIKTWLNRYNIENYELIEDEKYGYVVNVNGNVLLSHKNLKNIKVKFNKVNGNFNCNSNNLTSLEGCPEIVNNFNCSSNQLVSLKGSPKIINGNFSCYENQLKTLEGCPEIVNGDVYCSSNLLKIEELKYWPKIIKYNYINLFNNNELGLFEKITDFEELKEKINIFFEKEDIKKEKNFISKIINKEELNRNNKLNKI